MAALGSNMGKPKKEAATVSDKPKKKAVTAAKASKAKTQKKIDAKPLKQKEKKSVAKPAKKTTATKPKTEPVKKITVAKAKPAAKPVKKATAVKPKLKSKAVAPKKTMAKPIKGAPKSKKETSGKIELTKRLRNASLILEPSKRKKIRKTKVILEGDLNINNVDAFMEQIEPIFDDYDFIDFYQREVTSLDLCHIQMLYYFQHHPGRKGKTVTINSEMSTDLKKVVINAGFKEFMFIPKLV